jgi:hypothetical protein
MKKIIFVLVIMALSLGMTNMQAQTIVKDCPVMSGVRANSAGDTSQAIKVLKTDGDNLSFIVSGTIPDSVVVIHYATKDSVASDIYYQVSYNGTNFSTSTLLDSIKAGAGGKTTLTRSLYAYASAIKIAVIERSAGNAILTANKPNILVVVKKYFTQSPQWK